MDHYKLTSQSLIKRFIGSYKYESLTLGPRKINPTLGMLQTITNNIQGGRMRIKFKRLETFTTKPNAAGKTFNMTRIVGEALEGQLIGQEWSTKFFPSEKDLQSAAKAAKVNDILDVTLKKNGNFLNPVSIDTVDPSEVPAIKTPPNVTTTHERTDADERRDNLNIAVSIMGPKKIKDDTIDYLTDAAGVADLVGDYAKQEGAFQFSPKVAKNGIPEVEDSPDEVPEVEEVEVK